MLSIQRLWLCPTCPKATAAPIAMLQLGLQVWEWEVLSARQTSAQHRYTYHQQACVKGQGPQIQLEAWPSGGPVRTLQTLGRPCLSPATVFEPCPRQQLEGSQYGEKLNLGLEFEDNRVCCS